MAETCTNIDVILGGHTHTFLKEPIKIANGEHTTIINQCGWGGLYLGRIDVLFHDKKQNELTGQNHTFFNEKNTLV